MKKDQIIKEAKKCLKAHINFLKSLHDHILKRKEPFLSRSMFAAWCLDKYFNEQLKNDIEKAMTENLNKNAH